RALHSFPTRRSSDLTSDDYGSYFGIPYDPGMAIPVYGPASVTGIDDPPVSPPAPRVSTTRNENQEACSSERVTVPAVEGEREIRSEEHTSELQSRSD